MYFMVFYWGICNITHKTEEPSPLSWLVWVEKSCASGYHSLRRDRFGQPSCLMLFLNRASTRQRCRASFNGAGVCLQTADQVEILTELGCDRLQGYFFGKPMPLDAILETFDLAPEVARRTVASGAGSPATGADPGGPCWALRAPPGVAEARQ